MSYSKNINYSQYDHSPVPEETISNVINSEYTYCNNYPKTISDYCNTSQWVNNCGYGNICTFTLEPKQDVKRTFYKYNKLAPLSLPTSTPININQVWDI